MKICNVGRYINENEPERVSCVVNPFEHGSFICALADEVAQLFKVMRFYSLDRV